MTASGQHEPVTAVRARRQELGLTQDQLAAKAGLPLRTVVRIEQNKSTPTLRTLSAIAIALDVEVAALLPTGSAA